MSNFLRGVRIIAFTHVWAGPWATSVLADMGAEVIKIESNQSLDQTRTVTRFFNFYNRGVKSCTLDLKQPKGAELFKKLAKISDVVIENFPCRVLPSLGLGYDSLKEVNDDIIVVSLSGFGGTGPDKDYVAYASTVQAIGGLTASFGYPSGEPILDNVNTGDPVGSMYGVLGVISALYLRHKTGKGQHVDISESEGMTSIIPEVIMEYVMNGRIRPRMGNRDEIMAPHGCYQCKGEDKWVAMAVGTDEEWRALCQAMGNPEWSKDERFSDQFSRWQNQDELDKLITEWTRNFTPYEVMHKLQEVGVAAGPSFNTEELVNDPHVKERNAFIEQNHPEAGKILVYRSPWVSAGTKDNPPAPLLGEHNNYVFKELLGMPDKEFDQLIDEKVIY
ncbi:CaiB/BaiF CoA transferase family protein [Chloroflexota bacterium]